jgi:hypothetical protein
MGIPKTRNEQGVFLTGYEEVMSSLQTLESPKIRDRIIKAGLGSGLNRIRTAIRKEAPKGVHGGIKAAIGRQVKRGKQPGVWFAKAGVNVGVKKGGAKRAPHGHLVALGTEPRFREHIGGKFAYLDKAAQAGRPWMLSTGTMPENDFVGRGYEKSIGKAISSLRNRVAKKLAAEVKKLSKGK